MTSIHTDDWKDIDLASLANETQVEICFSAFTDGRGYSLAQMLKRKHGFSGRIIATGNIGEHQSVELKRAGFNGLKLENGQELDLDTQDSRSAFYSNYFH